MHLVFIDANNVFRRMIEGDQTGRPISNIFFYVQHNLRTPVVVWDGPNALSQRRALVPTYKENRNKMGDDIAQGFDQLRKVLQLSKASQVRVPGYEADDVIATLALRYSPKHDIYIDSNDGDFCQLGFPTSRNKPLPIDANQVPLYKTLVGDQSDNIKGIPGFGDKAWSLLAEFVKKKMTVWLENSLPENIPTSQWESEYVPKIVADFKEEPGFSSLEKSILKFAQQLPTLRKYYRIVRFINVPLELINEHTVVGKNVPAEAEKIFRQFMI